MSRTAGLAALIICPQSLSSSPVLSYPLSEVKLLPTSGYEVVVSSVLQLGKLRHRAGKVTSPWRQSG